MFKCFESDLMDCKRVIHCKFHIDHSSKQVSIIKRPSRMVYQIHVDDETLQIEANPSRNHMWQAETPGDFPIVLTDNGTAISSVNISTARLSKFVFTANRLLDNSINMATSYKLIRRFSLTQTERNSKQELYYLTNRHRIESSLSHFCAFLLTTKDYFNHHRK